MSVWQSDTKLTLKTWKKKKKRIIFCWFSELNLVNFVASQWLDRQKKAALNLSSETTVSFFLWSFIVSSDLSHSWYPTEMEHAMFLDKNMKPNTHPAGRSEKVHPHSLSYGPR